MEGMHQWDEKFRTLASLYSRLGAEAVYRKSDPASPEAVAALEGGIGYTLPASVRRFLTEIAASLLFEVVVPESLENMRPDHGLCDFKLDLSLQCIRAGERERKNWVKNVYNDPEDEYSRPWIGSRGLINLPEGGFDEGDLVALAHAEEGVEPRVIFLSHDGFTDENGAVLGNDFVDFVERFLAVGGVALTPWGFGPYLIDRTQGIQIDCDKAKAHRENIGLTR